MMLRQSTITVGLLILLLCAQGQAQVKEISPVEQRANNVMSLIQPAPTGFEKYFSKAFLAHIPAEKLTEVLTFYYANLGRCLKVEPTALKDSLTGNFNLVFEKNAFAPISLALDPAEPHLIIEFIIGNPGSLPSPPVADDPSKGFKEREVTFAGVGGLSLHGTLLLPSASKGKAPGLLLLPGSGPTGRNGDQPPLLVTDLLKQIAERLAKEGFASLRFDKRGAPGYARFFPTDVAQQNDFFSWDSFVGDAKAGLAFLQAQPEVDGKRIVVAGHSEGGTIAMQMGHDLQGAANAPAGLILLSTPGRTAAAIITEQVTMSLKRSGLTDDKARPYLEYVQMAFAQIEKDGTMPTNPPPSGLEGLFPPGAAKLLRVELAFDPAAVLPVYSGPVLVVQGEKDIQISATRDAPVIEAALKQRKRGAYEVFFVPSASHNLKKVDNENVEPGFAGPVVPAALDKIAAWMKKTLSR